MIKNKNLLLLASLVWMIAGFNVLRIGIISYYHNIYPLNLISSVIIFFIFNQKIFNRLVVKHTLRIINYTEPKHPFWHFFDLKSFVIMIFMITLGIMIRKFSLVSNEFIAVFYTGLGTSLVFAGAKFAINYIHYHKTSILK
ncbi:MAG: hypothetical protein ACRDA4_04470 [Filifactoraceae bacterium]